MAIEDYSTCFDCTTLHLKSALECNRCAACHSRWIATRERVLMKANDRALTAAAREILVGISQAGKGEPRSPAFLESAMNRLGGVANFGKICADELWRARGCDPETEKPIPGADASPMLAFKYAELLNRVMLQNDARETVEISQLSDDDLVSTLRGLMTNLVQHDPDYRRLIVEESLRIQPDLLQTASASEVVDAAPMDLSELGIGEKDASN
jgi:hypothetical protein